MSLTVKNLRAAFAQLTGTEDTALMRQTDPSAPLLLQPQRRTQKGQQVGLQAAFRAAAAISSSARHDRRRNEQERVRWI